MSAIEKLISYSRAGLYTTLVEQDDEAQEELDSMKARIERLEMVLDDVNNWLQKTGRRGTAHQIFIDEALGNR